MAWVRAASAAVLLAGPGALAFFSGGYFDRARLWAGVVAWATVVVAAIVCPHPWPRTRAAWLAVAGLAGLAAWSAVSIGWTPVRDAAQADAQRLLLYLGVFVAAVAVLRERRLARAAEPVLALGVVAAVVEGLSERLLPSVFTLAASDSVRGRLFQPLTYWNAMGLLAAIGVVLCVRMAGDATRPRWLRACAAGATPVLALGGYLTLSRGAILAAVVGLTLLAVLRPAREQLRAMAIVAAACAPPVVAGALLPEVRVLEGSAAARDTAGLVVLGILVVATLGAGAAVARGADRRAPAGLREVTARRARGPARAVAAVVGVGVVVVFGALTVQRHELVVDPVQAASTSRLASADSNRGDFWKVARGAFADEPLRGIGAGGFRVEWLRERPIPYAARDAHSVYLETPAELGLVGLGLLVAFLGGIVACAVRARALDPTLAAGPIAVGGAWLVHAGLDWDWEMPGVTLPALLLAAVLVAHAEQSSRPPAAAPPREQPTPDRRPVSVEVGR